VTPAGSFILLSTPGQFDGDSDMAYDRSMEGNFEVRNEQVENALKDIGQLVARSVPNGFGFAILMFNFGEGGGMFYVSNAQRKDMIKAMKEFVEREENKV
jgi:hypothetical protein